MVRAGGRLLRREHAGARGRGQAGELKQRRRERFGIFVELKYNFDYSKYIIRCVEVKYAPFTNGRKLSENHFSGANGAGDAGRARPYGTPRDGTGSRPGTATTMVKALADSGLAHYEPYVGVRLTAAEKSSPHWSCAAIG